MIEWRKAVAMSGLEGIAFRQTIIDPKRELHQAEYPESVSSLTDFVMGHTPLLRFVVGLEISIPRINSKVVYPKKSIMSE